MNNNARQWLQYAKNLRRLNTGDERHLLRFVMSLGAILFSVLLGITQVDVIYMRWYPIVAWLITLRWGASSFGRLKT